MTIGVFDSGFGGLTVLRALLRAVPSADYLYLGDTARLPYGSKSRDTVARYAGLATRFLMEQGADLLVIACNTATALALPEIRVAAAPVPVFGVVEPGAEAALAATDACGPGAAVLVMATAATVQSHAYLDALTRLGLRATEKACPLLVPLVEEGWLAAAGAGGLRAAAELRADVTLRVLRIYLGEALAETPEAQTLLLGCTHYPLLRAEIAETLAGLGRPLRIIDSAEATAAAVAAQLGRDVSSVRARRPNCTFYATDSVEKFERLGPHFLGQALPHVSLVDLGG